MSLKTTAVRIKVTLKDVKPEVMRRLVVPVTLRLDRLHLTLQSTHPTSAVLSEAWYFAKRVTLSLALRSSGDAGRGFGRVGAATALVAG
jgi:Plasmid pRiA4b ORF-3-like protein